VRELKLILDGQNGIHRSIKSLLVKLDEVVGRQERQLSLLTMISQQQHGQPPPSDQRQVIIIINLMGLGSLKHPMDLRPMAERVQ